MTTHFKRFPIVLAFSVSLSVFAQTPENVLVVIADDVGVDQLSCYAEGCDPACSPLPSCDFPNTPNICDRLATNGVLFRNAWSNPSCSPTRSTGMTGRYGFRTGVFVAGNTLPCTEITLAEVLKDPLNQPLGYASAQIGKWHLSGGNFGCGGLMSCGGATITPITQGFDHFAGAPSNIAGSYFNWLRWEDGALCQSCVAGGSVPECAVQPYATIVNVNDALEWTQQQTGPWFLWLAFNAPHAPYQAPPAQCPTGLCHGVTLPVPEGQTCPFDQSRPCYKAMLETLDHELGRLLDNLPANTSVIFLGDNGTPGGSPAPGLVQCPFDPTRAKFTLYEGGINVPLIISAPRVTDPVVVGTESDALVNIADVFATVLGLAGAVIPPAIQHDSVSVLPHLRNPDTHLRSYVFSENNQITSASYQKTTRDDRFKMLRTPNSTAENIQFFDLAGDPGAVPPEPADPFEDVDLYDDASPSLTQVQQDHFEDLQESLDFLAGQIDVCPASLPCTLSGTCQPVPSRCVTTNTGMAACVQNNSLFQCPPRQFIRIRNCPCRKAGPGAACRSVDQSWFCQ